MSTGARNGNRCACSTPTVLGERAFEYGGAGLSAMADWLLSLTAGQAGDVGVALETPRGLVVESLMERGFVVHAINPKQLDRFRGRFSPAGAKDDRRDARVLASELRTDPHCLRRLESTDPTVLELREWSRLSEDLTRERTRLAHRMREQLWRYPRSYSPRSVTTSRRPGPSTCGVAAQWVGETTLAGRLDKHRIRQIDAPALRRQLRAEPVKVAPGAAEAADCTVGRTFSVEVTRRLAGRGQRPSR